MSKLRPSASSNVAGVCGGPSERAVRVTGSSVRGQGQWGHRQRWDVADTPWIWPWSTNAGCRESRVVGDPYCRLPAPLQPSVRSPPANHMALQGQDSRMQKSAGSLKSQTWNDRETQQFRSQVRVQTKGNRGCKQTVPTRPQSVAHSSQEWTHPDVNGQTKGHTPWAPARP